MLKVIAGIISVILLIGVIGSMNNGDSMSEITKSQAEKVCQDANFLQNYVDLNDTKIVTLKYSPAFMDAGDGKKYLSWNGERRSTGESIVFECTVAKSGDDVVVRSLTIDGKDLLKY